MKVHCAYCKKELDSSEASVVHKFNKNLFYCPEHKGFKTKIQFFWEIVLDVLNERQISSDLSNSIKPIVHDFGMDLILSFLHERKEFYENLIYQKEIAHDFTTTFAKIQYFCTILKRELPKFVLADEQEKEIMLSAIYEPEMDNRMRTHPRYHTRETMEEKRNRINKKLEETQEHDEIDCSDFMSYFKTKASIA